MSQLALPLQLADHAVFASFLGAGNETLVATLAGIAGGEPGQGCWLWGGAATGKTHLLQAVCDRAGDRSVYVPLDMLAAAGPGILEGLGERELVCVDDFERVAGDADWELALFGLCNELGDAGGQLVVAAAAAPRECNIRLADLESRLSRLPVFQLHALDEQQRAAALQLRARHRGLELPDETAAYLLRHSRRDMASLYDLLDKLDLEALRAKRRLTIPFVREVIARGGTA
ncbi:MAG: DnaA regulatory inactivator Hda [Gammaproteobacteria bacterium]|nr:DnaA regulatory inactivator Hda [Gammaproteobacteria bacterium]